MLEEKPPSPDRLEPLTKAMLYTEPRLLFLSQGSFICRPCIYFRFFFFLKKSIILSAFIGLAQPISSTNNSLIVSEISLGAATLFPLRFPTVLWQEPRPQG